MISKQALSIQLVLLKEFTEIAIGIEKHGTNYSAGRDDFFIEEDISLLKVLIGESHSMFKDIISLKKSIDLKIAGNKDPALYY